MGTLNVNLRVISQIGKCLESCVFSKLAHLSRTSSAIRLLREFLAANLVLNCFWHSKLEQVQNHLSQSGVLGVNPVLKQIGNTKLDSSLEKMAGKAYKSSFLSFYFFLFLLTHSLCGIVFPPFRGEYVPTYDVLGISKLESAEENFRSDATVVVSSNVSTTTTAASHKSTNSRNSHGLLPCEHPSGYCGNKILQATKISGRLPRPMVFFSTEGNRGFNSNQGVNYENTSNIKPRYKSRKLFRGAKSL